MQNTTLVKMFESTTHNELEVQINKWLAKHSRVTVHDIKLAMCGIWCGDSPAVIRTAIILYDEER